MQEKAYVVNIDVTLQQGGFFMLNSYDLPGLCLLGKDPIRIMRQVPDLVKKLFKANFGLDVKVIPASLPAYSKLKQEDMEKSKTWTAIEIEEALA